jgi:hypothetical protein
MSLVHETPLLVVACLAPFIITLQVFNAIFTPSFTGVSPMN